MVVVGRGTYVGREGGREGRRVAAKLVEEEVEKWKGWFYYH